jgi:hypothetical protein
MRSTRWPLVCNELAIENSPDQPARRPGSPLTKTDRCPYWQVLPPYRNNSGTAHINALQSIDREWSPQYSLLAQQLKRKGMERR